MEFFVPSGGAVEGNMLPAPPWTMSPGFAGYHRVQRSRVASIKTNEGFLVVRHLTGKNYLQEEDRKKARLT